MDIYFAKVLEWLEKLKNEGQFNCEWIGVFFNDKTAGPYIGENLEHLSIKEQYEHLKKSKSLITIPQAFGEILITFIDENPPPHLNEQLNAALKTFPAIKNYLPFRLPTLESSRLILKNLDESDAQDIFEFASNPKVAQFMAWGPHKSIDDSLRMIRNAKANYEKGWPIPLGIVLKNGGQRKVVGIVGLTLVSAKHRTFELVYALGEENWGKGILVEASKLLINFSFDHFAMNRLQCSCKVENTQSARVMEKLGMKYEGILRSFLHLKGESWDLKIYSLLKSEHRPYSLPK